MMGIVAIPQRATSVADPLALETSNAAPALSPYLLSAIDGTGHFRKIDDIETEIVRLAIARYRGHISEVARHLGIGRSTLYRKLKELGLQQPSEPAQEEPRTATG